MHRQDDATAPGGYVERVEHIFVDELGTPRAFSNANGLPVRSATYWPYGARMLNPWVDRETEEAQKLQFTGHERDFHGSWQDDIDYMHARYHSPYPGRFLSVDPADSWKVEADRPSPEPKPQG